jgi:hypothetical protein
VYAAALRISVNLKLEAARNLKTKGGFILGGLGTQVVAPAVDAAAQSNRRSNHRKIPVRTPVTTTRSVVVCSVVVLLWSGVPQGPDQRLAKDAAKTFEVAFKSALECKMEEPRKGLSYLPQV